MRPFLFFLFLFCSLVAEPLAIYLTWIDDPLTTMEVMWLTSCGGSDQLTMGEKSFQGKHEYLPQLSATLHQVSLKELKPGEIYSFSVEGENYRFQVPKGDLPLHFIVAGDCYHGDKPIFVQMLKTMSEQKPDFVVFAGDLAYTVVKKRGPEAPLRWITFFEATNQYLKNGDLLIPFITTIGNHEVIGSFGQTPEQAKLYYTFFPNGGYRKLNFDTTLSLFLLDSGHTHEIPGAQTEWLAKALKEDKKIPYRFAIYHVPAYPSVRPYTYRPSREIRKNWVPLFEENKILAAFEHHDHALKRTFPILNKEVVSEHGVVYFGDGSCGVDDPRPPKQVGTVWYLAHSKQSQAVWDVSLTKEKATFKALGLKGEILDQTTLAPLFN